MGLDVREGLGSASAALVDHGVGVAGPAVEADVDGGAVFDDQAVVAGAAVGDQRQGVDAGEVELVGP